MGNIHSSIANQLLPFEVYIADTPEIKYLHGLSSTRFMKMARAEHSVDGPVAIKVFVPVDQSVSLDPYKEAIIKLRSRLAGHVNCCAFTRVYITHRCAILLRPYHKYTLYERMSTQPLLLDVEKAWIIFQLLKALAQCRIAMACHGDIGSENVLVSSSLWVQLTDFAPFKPAFLPYDNPSTFTYFFDTSRRRCCNLAPERFKRTDEITHLSRLPGDSTIVSDGLTSAMDIFAMGCVIVELLTNGQQLAFTFSQAIDYKRMDDHSARRCLMGMLSTLPEAYRELLMVMLDRDPKKRKEEYERMKPCNLPMFPMIFEKFLYRYLKEFHQDSMPPDDIITKLYVEFDNFHPNLVKDEYDSAVLIVGVVTSTLRACRTLNSKMDAIALLQKLSKLCSKSIVADRILPYLVHLLADHAPQVRSESICVMVEILTDFDTVPPDECRLLIDYIFPKLKAASMSDTSNLTRIALASNLGRLASVSLRFLDACLNRVKKEAAMMIPSPSPPEGRAHSPASPPHIASDREKDLVESLVQDERHALNGIMEELFVNLCGCDNEVRRCLFEAENLHAICNFFGREKASEVLMHMITLLNDKPDWRIRATFFESCPIVATYLGRGRSGELEPFLLQGLNDREDSVTLQALRCIHSLCEQQLLHLTVICHLLPHIVPFLVHPFNVWSIQNIWLRMGVIDILLELDNKLSVADFYCRVSPLLRPFFSEPLIRYYNRHVLYQCLVRPIPQQLWQTVVDYAHAPELLTALENRKTLEKLGGGKNSLFSTAAPVDSTTQEFITAGNGGGQRKPHDTSTPKSATSHTALIKKLTNLGLDEATEEKLFTFKEILSKMDRRIIGGTSPSKHHENSHIHLGDLRGVHRRVFDLERGAHRAGHLSKSLINQIGDDFASTSTFHSFIDPMSTESLISDLQTFRCSIPRFNLAETLIHKLNRYQAQRRIATTGGTLSLAAGDGTTVAEKIAAAAIDEDVNDYEAGRLENNSRSYPSRSMNHAQGEEAGCGNQLAKGGSRRLEVKLVAQMHEHGDKIVKLAMHPDKNHFASCSAGDGAVRMWSASSLLAQDSSTHPAWMALDSLKFPHRIESAGFLGNGNIAIATSEGELQAFDIECKRLLKSYSVDVEKEGAISMLHCHDHLVYALTRHNFVYCLDLRVTPANSRNPIGLESVWKRTTKNTYGLITSFCVDELNQHWMLLTGSSTTTKNLLLWDLRFAGLEVAAWSHPSDRVIPLKSWARPHGSACTEAFTNCSREGEVSIWDLGTQSRTEVLWPSSAQPLHYKEERVTTALAMSCVDPDLVLTGDSKGSLRCWNLRKTEASSYLCGPYRKYVSDTAQPSIIASGEMQSPTSERIRYRQTHPDSLLKVLVEEKNQLASAVEKDSHKALRVGEYHANSITDLLSMWPDILVSSDWEGVIKLWKIN